MKIRFFLNFAAALGLLAAMAAPAPLAQAQNRGKPAQNPVQRCATLEKQIDDLYLELDALEDGLNKISVANLQNRKRLWKLQGKDRENEQKKVDQQENESQRRVVGTQYQVALKRNQIGRAEIEVGQIERRFFHRGKEGPDSHLSGIEREILKGYDALDAAYEQIKDESLSVLQHRNKRANLRGSDRDNQLARTEDQIHAGSLKLVHLRSSVAKGQNKIGRLETELLKRARSRRGFR